jgi:DNA polymerase III delta prime subunit
MDIEKSLWVEKYRPIKMEDIVLPDRYKKDFERLIARQDMINLLFSGPPGGGKTTIGRILCSPNGVLHNPEYNMLFVNGSAKESRSIKYVDGVIEPYLQHPPVKDSFKVVFIDEADNLTPEAFKSLRGIIEKYHVGYARFLFTCNYPSNIPDPLHSRFTHYRFKQMPKDFVLNYCKRILDLENIEYKDEDINVVIDALHPDIRKIINALYKNSWADAEDETKAGRLDVDKDTVSTNESTIISNVYEIIAAIETGTSSRIAACVDNIIKLIENDEVDYRHLYVTLFHAPKVPLPAKIIVNREANRHQGCLIPHMHFMSMVYDIIKALQALRKAYMTK